MRRSDELPWPGLGHSRAALNAALRKTRSELAYVLSNSSKVKQAARECRTLRAREADLREGLKALSYFADAPGDKS